MKRPSLSDIQTAIGRRVAYELELKKTSTAREPELYYLGDNYGYRSPRAVYLVLKAIINNEE